MKWILYSISALATFLGIGFIGNDETVFQKGAGLIMLLIGTMSFGFGAVVGKLDKLARQNDRSNLGLIRALSKLTRKLDKLEEN